jgi:uncharacterized delta-60 repeat protein
VESFNGIPSQCVARLNANGSLDQTFYPGTGPNFGGFVNAVAGQTNGMVLIGGIFTTVDGLPQQYLARLRADGSLDLTYTNIINSYVSRLLNLSNGGVLALGSFSSVNGTTMNNIARFNPDGTLDTTFQPAASNGGIEALAVQNNGFVVIAGNFTSVGGYSYQSVARLTSSGAVDTSFVGPGLIGPSDSIITAIAIESNDQMVVGGNFTTMNGYSELGIARLNSDGSLDTTFRAPLNGSFHPPLCLQTDGKVLMNASFGLERLNSDGSQDTSFTPTVNSVNALAVQPDGRILLAGGFSVVNGTNLNGIARLLGDSASQAGVQLLNMNLYPGMFLSGSIGTNYLVEYTTNLNSPTLWTPLTNLTLSNNPTFIADPTLPNASRFYRAVTVP